MVPPRRPRVWEDLHRLNREQEELVRALLEEARELVRTLEREAGVRLATSQAH